MYTFIKPWIRTSLIWLGLILFWTVWFLTPEYGEPYITTIRGVEYIMQDPLPIPGYYWFLFVLAATFTMIGCYIWTKLKNRHWAFTFWGLLTPIGLLGIALLKDKSLVISNTEIGGN